MNRLTRCVVVFFAFFMGSSVLEVFGGPVNLLPRIARQDEKKSDTPVLDYETEIRKTVSREQKEKNSRFNGRGFFDKKTRITELGRGIQMLPTISHWWIGLSSLPVSQSDLPTINWRRGVERGGRRGDRRRHSRPALDHNLGRRRKERHSPARDASIAERGSDDHLMTFEGTLLKYSPHPKIACGIFFIHQVAKYRVDRVLSGKYVGDEIVVDHPTCGGNVFENVPVGSRVRVTVRVWREYLVTTNYPGIRDEKTTPKVWNVAGEPPCGFCPPTKIE